MTDSRPPYLFLFRLTLECGDYVLKGPYDSPDRIDGQPIFMIGDITGCPVCPLHASAPDGSHNQSAFRQVVDVTPIPPERYRPPTSEEYRKRTDQQSIQHVLEDRALREECTDLQNWSRVKAAQLSPWVRPPAPGEPSGFRPGLYPGTPESPSA